MKSDGSIIIDTKILDGGMEKGFDELKSEMRSVGVTAKQAGDKIALSFSNSDVTKQISNAASKVRMLEQQFASVTSDLKYAVADNDDRSAERLAAKQIKIYDRLELARERLANEIASAAKKQAAAEEKAAKKAEASATKAMRRFNTRLGSIVSGALVFNIISQGLRGVTDYFGKALKSNEDFAKSVSQLKGALLTAFQPIYEFVMPGLLSLVHVATNAAQAIGKIFSSLTGKQYGQMAKNAEALYEQANATEEVGKAAKEAQKHVASFDEIEKVSAKNNNGSSFGEVDEVKPDFSAFDGLNYQSKLESTIALTSLALVALGTILAFSGVNIPLGIGMMALGAASLYNQATTNWAGLREAITGETGVLIAIISAALLAIGAILAFSGIALPLGIALIALGAAGLAAEVALNWGAIKDALQGPIGDIVAIVSGALLAIGAILAFTGVGIPLGIALIALGAAGLVTVAAVNWNSIKEKVVPFLASILAIISGASIVIGLLLCLSGVGIGVGLALLFAGIAGSVAAWSLSDNPVTRFVKDMVNGLIGAVNLVIDAINSLFHLKFNGLWIAGVEVIPAFNKRLLNIPKIPYLAEGAVIPPNAPFMAMLGDQRHGTNIEAPLSTIQEAVAEVMDGYLATNMAGHEATVAVLREILEAVLGIQIGDDVIAQAAERYTRKMNIARGGAL